MKYLILLLILLFGSFMFVNSINTLDIILWTLKLTFKFLF